MPEPGPLLGAVLELDIGGPAHGGSCVARHDNTPHGRAVFVRHTLPGERVRAVVTEDRGGNFCFADAVEILAASPERVEPPCAFAGPGRCGGCDWQHATGSVQRTIKATVILDQFSRLARLDVADLLSGVEELPGGLLGWRSRVTYAIDEQGRTGLRRHGSHEVEPVSRCVLAMPNIDVPPVPDDLRTGGAETGGAETGGAQAAADPVAATGVELATGTDPDDRDAAVLVHRPGRGRQSRGRRPPDRVELVGGPSMLRHTVLGREFGVAAGGFWQVHPAAADTFARALLDAVGPKAGETVLDLYAGAGALTASLADAVGAGGRVVGIESDEAAVRDAVANLAELPHASMRRMRVTAAALQAIGATTDDLAPDVIVLDPPRAGAGREVMQALLALRPRVVGYVACDPAALARDVATAQDEGWRLTALRAFDAFPMTQHVECVATLEPA